MFAVEQVKRDGRVVRGVQKGVGSFLHTLTVETLDMSSKVISHAWGHTVTPLLPPVWCLVACQVAYLTQYLFETAGSVLAPEGEVRKLTHLTPRMWCRGPDFISFGVSR